MNSVFKQAMDASVPEVANPNDAFLSQAVTQNASTTLPSPEERKTQGRMEEAARKADALKPLV